MENQGTFDFAIFGDGPGALITALLLSKQGERVIVIPEPAQRSRQSRFLYGYEAGGLIQGLLKRWGLPDEWLSPHVVESPVIELASPHLTFALRDRLDRGSLGSLGFELRGDAGERFLAALNGLEQSTAWLENFHSDLIAEMQKVHRGWRRYLLPSRNTAQLWTRVLRRHLRAQVTSGVIRSLRQWEQESDRTTEEVRLLKSGVGTLMGSKRSGISTRSSRLLQTLLELYTIRRTPLVRNRGEALIKQFKVFLKHQGVTLVDERERVQLKKGEAGRWEGIYGDSKKSLSHFHFENLVFAHSLSDSSLELFEESARKTLEGELRNEPFLVLEWSAKVSSHQLPFGERTEIVYTDRDFPAIQLSIYGAEDGFGLESGQSLLQARTLLPDLSKLPTDTEQLRARFQRVITEIFPMLELSGVADIRFRMERQRDFPPRSGVRTRNARIFHVNHASYPHLGEFGPFVAAMDLARKFARRRKRELRL